jgi:rRNA-processing protein FCF1
VYLASALQLRDDLGIGTGEFALATSDQELKAAALKAGLAVVDLQEEAARAPHLSA